MYTRYPKIGSIVCGIELLLVSLVLSLVSCRSEPVAPVVQPTATTANEATSVDLESSMDGETELSPPGSTVYLPLTSDDPIRTEAPTSPLAPTPTPMLVPTTTPVATATPAFPAYVGPTIDRWDMGVQIHLHRENVSLLLDHLQTLGVGWVKLQISWKVYQPYRETYSEERFAELDRLIEMAMTRKLSVLLSVSKAPEWSRATTEMDGPPLDYATYEEFLSVLAGRYQGRVAAYELWNEPNLQREWNGAPLNAANFVTLVKVGAASIRAADSMAIIISGAPAPTGINDGDAAIDDRVYFREMLNAGISEAVDAFGAHPYGWSNPPESSFGHPAPGVPSHNDHPSFFFRDTLNDYHSIITGLGIDKQIWVTEFGWGSFDGFGQPPTAGAEFMAAVSEWQQADYVQRAFALVQGWDWVGPMMLWNLNFGPTLGRQFSESGYSLLGTDGNPRPVYAAVVAIPKR